MPKYRNFHIFVCLIKSSYVVVYLLGIHIIFYLIGLTVSMPSVLTD